jgi:hypothetical protein
MIFDKSWPGKLTWKPATGHFETGERCCAGPYVVGSFTRALVARGEPTAYDANVLLPGITLKPEFKRHSTEEGAKRVVEAAVRTWFNRATCD